MYRKVLSPEKGLRKSTKIFRIAGPQAKIQTREHSNTKQACYPLEVLSVPLYICSVATSRMTSCGAASYHVCDVGRERVFLSHVVLPFPNRWPKGGEGNVPLTQPHGSCAERPTIVLATSLSLKIASFIGTGISEADQCVI
jgi:hypothetical protein